MRRMIYDLFRVPYYRALLVKHGEVIGIKIVPQKGNIKDFRVKSLKARFILPDDAKTGIPPLKIKSGRLVVYDINSAISMRLVRKSEDGLDWMDEDLRKEYIVNPSQFYLTPLDVSELNKFLDSKITDDILSDNEREIPWWIVAIVITGIAVAGIVIIAWMILNHVTPPVIIPSFTPTPTPTMIPGYMEVR